MYLNAWGIKLPQHFFPFVTEWVDKIDVFAFQEIFSSRTERIHDGAVTNGYEQLTSLLPGHHGLFAPSSSEFGYTGPVDFQLFFGLALFVRKGLSIQSYTNSFIAGNYNAPILINGKPRGPRNMQGLEVPITISRCMSLTCMACGRAEGKATRRNVLNRPIKSCVT